MTFSYSPSLPSPLHRVRFLIGDTVDAGHLVENQEITYTLSIQPIETFAAAAIAESLAARFAGKPDVRVGQTSVSNSALAAQYRELAARLRAAGGTIAGGDGTGPTASTMYVGGISRDERLEQYADDDAILPSFRLGKDDHPGTTTEANDLGEDA